MADEKSIEELGTVANRLPEIRHNLIHVPSSEYKCIFSDEDLKKAEEWRLEFERFSNVIFVDNLPEVPKENVDFLKWIVRNMFSEIGVIKDDGFWIPIDTNTQKTLGYCYIKYNPNTSQVNREHRFPEKKARDILEKEEEIAKNKEQDVSIKLSEQDVSRKLSEQNCEKRKRCTVKWEEWVISDMTYMYYAERLLSF